jgi:hypothetical protein
VEDHRLLLAESRRSRKGNGTNFFMAFKRTNTYYWITKKIRKAKTIEGWGRQATSPDVLREAMDVCSKNATADGLPIRLGPTGAANTMVIQMSKGTMTVAIIVLIQLAATLLLYNKIEAVEHGIATVTGAQQIAVQQGEPGKAVSPLPYGQFDVLPAEDRLRQIIQEELRAQLSDLSGTGQQANAPVEPGPIDVAEMEFQRQRISQQLEYYSSLGEISDADMQLLQMDIARLDAASRTEMLGELNRAINSGRLDGRL